MKASATTVLKLLQGSKVFVVPRFQRRYDWRLTRWQPFWEDILHEYAAEHDGSQEYDGHFLGSVVLHPAPGPASTLMRHLVIDGQQRLTTLLVLLAALRDVHQELDPDGWDPKEIDDQYLRNPYAKTQDETERLLPTEPDRVAYVKTVREGIPTDGVGAAYDFFASRIREWAKTPGADLAKLETTILLHLILVEINTTHGDSVNAIFNTLNSKNQPLTPPDLVRNELLLHVGDENSEFAYSNYWMPMEQHLITVRKTANGPENNPAEFKTFLWAREAVYSPEVTKDGLFPYFEKRLRASLNGLESERRKARALELVQETFEDHELFLIVRRPERAEELRPQIAREVIDALQLLADWGSETTTPFALWGLKEYLAGRVDANELVQSVEILMGFLVRRILAGYQTQTLNRTLTPLANEVSKDRSVPMSWALTKALSRPGSYWVDDKTVLARVTSTALYSYRRANVFFILKQIEDLLPGPNHEVIAKNQIDHIMPRTLSGDWLEYFRGRGVKLEDASALSHTLGNLTLTNNNQKMGQGLFSEKKAEFFANSALRLNQQLNELEEFTPVEIIQRGQDLASLLLTRFPGPPTSTQTSTPAEDEQAVVLRIRTILQGLPDGTWTSVNDLVPFLAVTDDEVKSAVNAVNQATLVRLVREVDGTVPSWLSGSLRELVQAQSTGPLPAADRLTDIDLIAIETELINTLNGDSDSVDGEVQGEE
ncbi:MAG: DUF262 domain-containing protein [Microcella pacifica]